MLGLAQNYPTLNSQRRFVVFSRLQTKSFKIPSYVLGLFDSGQCGARVGQVPHSHFPAFLKIFKSNICDVDIYYFIYVPSAINDLVLRIRDWQTKRMWFNQLY